MKYLFIFIIKFYQQVAGMLEASSIKRKSGCAFLPSCSEYSIEAAKKYGAFKGGLLSVRRFLRCHPWQKNHIDLVP